LPPSVSRLAGGSYCNDITVPLLGVDRIVEAKSRSRGFQQLYDWLESRDLLVVRADRRESLVVIPLKLAIEIATAAERSKHPNSPNSGRIAPPEYRRR
jgi:hypothetical protein